MLDAKASRWIAKLRLKKHAEGGYFRETHRSEIMLEGVRGCEGKSRKALSAIYYMLAHDQVSAFHRLNSDEIWPITTAASWLFIK